MSVITTLNLKVMGQKLVGKSGYIQRTEPRISDCALFERLLILKCNDTKRSYPMLYYNRCI